MIQRAASRDIAAEVVARITEAMHPWRIVLFGSRARGRAKEHSDYDIYVEVDAPDDEALREIDEQIRAVIDDREWTLDLKVARRGAFERRRDDPGTIEWDVAREGIVLYADPMARTELTSSDRVREPSPDMPESVNEWLESAERDLRHRDFLRSAASDYSPEICWLSHQTAEQHMKALLVARRMRPERTHDLRRLLRALRSVGPELAQLDAACKLLTKHAIKPRYPAGMKLRAKHALKAVDAAERIIAAVREQLPPHEQ